MKTRKKDKTKTLHKLFPIPPLPLYGSQFPFIATSTQSLHSYIHPSIHIYIYINQTKQFLVELNPCLEELSVFGSFLSLSLRQHMTERYKATPAMRRTGFKYTGKVKAIGQERDTGGHNDTGGNNQDQGRQSQGDR